MPVVTWFAHHRLWALGLGLAAVLLAVAVGVWFFLIRSPGSQLDLHQALRLYRQDQRSSKSVAADADLPPAGVYRYRTTGGEQLSIGSISRAFPAASTMIVTDARCATMNWEPLVQHVEGLVVCPTSGAALGITSILSYEQIAGTQTRDVMQCPPGAYFVPPAPSVGRRWSATCRGTGQTVRLSGRIIGSGTVTVGRNKVAALHTRITLTFSGSESGTNPADYWVSPTGVILREVETVQVNQSAGPLGSVHYSEHMAIALGSLTPAR